jgi:hypothetical protein
MIIRKISWLVFGIILTSMLSSCVDDNTTKGNDYTITFDADGGAGNIPSPMKVHAEYSIAYVILPNASLTKGESQLIGWREPGFTFYSRPGEKISVTKDTELKAVYQDGSNTGDDNENNNSGSSSGNSSGSSGNNSGSNSGTNSGSNSGNNSGSNSDTISGFYVTRTGKKYHKYGHQGATIPLSEGTHGPYSACAICF